MVDFGNDAEFIQNYEQLKSSRKMGELYHCDKKTINNKKKKIGYDFSKHKERKITSIPLDEIIAASEELHSAAKVGERYGCSGTAVNNYLKKNGYNLQRSNAKLANVSNKEFIAIYKELQSAKKVGEYYKCSETAVLNHAKKIGYDINSAKVHKLTLQDKEAIIAAYDILSSTQLAEQYQVSRGIITKIWHDAELCNKINKTVTTTAIDLTGQTFGLWKVLYQSDKRDNRGNVYWHCKCECGIERDISSASLRQGTSLSCGAHSNISKGNEVIKLLLIKANIPFEIEKKFSTCKDKKPLPFDFYVNNQYLIEYDGIQHFKNTIFDYEYTHKHDLIKSKWCKENKIPLIRIPYTHFDNLCLEDLQLNTSSFIER